MIKNDNWIKGKEKRGRFPQSGRKKYGIGLVEIYRGLEEKIQDIVWVTVKTFTMYIIV